MTGRGREPGAQPASKMSADVTVMAAMKSECSANGKSQEKMRLRWKGVNVQVSMEGMLTVVQLKMRLWTTFFALVYFAIYLVLP